MLELPPRFLAAFASLAHAPLGVRQEHGPSHCSRISGSDTVGCMRYWNTALLLALTCVLGSCSSGENTGSEAPAQTSPTPPANSNSAPSAVFVLGDSLSDVGNAAAAIDFFLNFPPYPPTVGLCNPKDVLNFGRSCDQLFYRQSRVSNGPVAVEYLAERLGVGELKPSIHFLTDRPVMGADYAVAGAKAREDRRGDLARQVGMLIFDHSERLPADALYERVRQDRNRPLLATADPAERLRDLYQVRDPFYREIADLVIETGRQSVQGLARDLFNRIREAWKLSA